jgi:hypothetical protein
MFVHKIDRLIKNIPYDFIGDVTITGDLTVTGDGTIATPSNPADDTTAIPTTEWVNAAITAGGGLPLQAAGDANKFLMSNGTAADWYTILVPNDTPIGGINSMGDTVGLLKLNKWNEIDFLADVNIFALKAEPDTYGSILDIGMTSDGDYGDKAGAKIWIGGSKILELRAQNDGTGGLIDGSDYIIAKGLWVTDERWTQSTITTDTQLGDVPAKYMLQYIVFEETAGNAATIDLGTTGGASDIFVNQVIAASTITTVTIEETFSLTAATELYLNDNDAGSDWNSASVDVYVVLKKVIE